MITTTNNMTLSAYLQQVQQTIKVSFVDAVWVKAEITNLSTKGGHIYLELAEKDPENHHRIAATRGNIWQFTAKKIIPKFEKETGIRFDKDLNVLIKLKATFSPEYGFSLNIEDIDPNYTIGDIARKYQEIRNRLIEEGLINLNKQLVVASDFYKILVIAPENAAGLGDFKKDADALQRYNVCEFYYHYCLFQGNLAPVEIQNTLKYALKKWSEAHPTAPDLIVIIRGGGAVNDLAYLNDYDLAALLCKRKVPVWVGIGHERDKTILDEVANRSFDTPSKVIAGIRNTIVQSTQQAETNYQSIVRLSGTHLLYYKKEIEQLKLQTNHAVITQLTNAKRDIEQYINNTFYFAQLSLKNSKQLIEQYFRETLLQSPRRTLEKGYAIVRQKGQVINSIKQLQKDSISIELQDGQVQANITQITES